MANMERRPIETRNKKWAQKLAAFIAGLGISPNSISVSSSFFAILTLGSLYLYSDGMNPIWLIAAIATIQLRLLANLFDGMVAIEFNKKSKMGDVYNDLPDRISDCLVLIGFSFVLKNSKWGVELSYLAALVSVMTAYIRILGSSLGVKDLFLGPMAKQHRMALITACCLIGIFWQGIFYPMIFILNIGLMITCVRRVQKINRALAV